MGCYYSKDNRCHSLFCCFCMKPRTACYWIGCISLVWEGIGTAFDFTTANLHSNYCPRNTKCIDLATNKNLSFAGGIIRSVQLLTSILLIHGARTRVPILIVLWMAWAVVSLGMQFLWSVITIPYAPSFRGFAAVFQLIWGIHYFIVVKTHYTQMTLTFTDPIERSKTVPPNSPCRKHKRRKRRVDPNALPPIRTLLGAAIRLQKYVGKKKLLPHKKTNQGGEVVVLSNLNDNNGFSNEELLLPEKEKTEDEGFGEVERSQAPNGDDHNHDTKENEEHYCGHDGHKEVEEARERREEGKKNKRTSYLHKQTKLDDDERPLEHSMEIDDSVENVVMDIREKDVVETTEPPASYGCYENKDIAEESKPQASSGDEDDCNVCLMPGGPQSPVQISNPKNKKVRWMKVDDGESSHDPLSDRMDPSKDDLYANGENRKNSDPKIVSEDIKVTTSEDATRDPTENLSSRRISYKIAVGHDEKV